MSTPPDQESLAKRRVPCMVSLGEIAQLRGDVPRQLNGAAAGSRGQLGAAPSGLQAVAAGRIRSASGSVRMLKIFFHAAAITGLYGAFSFRGMGDGWRSVRMWRLGMRCCPC